MNRKGYSPVLIVLLIILVIGGVVVYNAAKSPSSSPAGNAVSNSYSNQYSNEYSNCGDYGQSCCSPDNFCGYGECQGGICTHCGFFGETCCFQRDSPCETGSECYFGICKVKEDYFVDCGHVGYAPCSFTENIKCYTGVYDGNSGLCVACGDYEQPCCQETPYDCDYGKCVYGICKRVDDTQSNNQNNALPSQPYANPTPAPSDTDTSSCGYLNEPCCQDAGRLSPMGALDSLPPCFGGLECTAGYCVQGPEYEAYSP
jgi:hypothetical protein